MENRSVRKDEWKQSSGVVVGPGNYDISSYKAKESFNYGSVPFGSHSSKQDLHKTRAISYSTN